MSCPTYIPVLQTEDPCGGNRISTKCIFDENAFIELGLPLNSTQEQINQALYQVVLAQRLLIASLTPNFQSLSINTTQENDTPPTINILQNTTSKSFTSVRNSVGNFSIVPNSSLADSLSDIEYTYQPYNWFVPDSKIIIKVFANQISIRTYISGVLSDGVLNNTSIKINIY